jgi:probable addiction module antidote protein
MANKARSVKYSPTDYLKTKEDMVEYLNAAIEDGNERVLLMALRNVVDSLGGMTRLAKETGLTRESLYRTLSEKGNPRLSSLVAMLHYMDLELAVRPRNSSDGARG